MHTCNTVCDKMVCQPYIQCTRCSCGSAETLNRLSGFSLSKEDVQCWQIDDGEKRNGVEGLESIHTHTRINTHTHAHNGPILKEYKTSVVVHQDVRPSLYLSEPTLYILCLLTLYRHCTMSAFLHIPPLTIIYST